MSDSRTGTSAQLTDVESSSVSYVDSSAGANDPAFLPADDAGRSSTRAATDSSAGANDPAFLPADAAGGSSTRAATDSSASANDPCSAVLARQLSGPCRGGPSRGEPARPLARNGQRVFE